MVSDCVECVLCRGLLPNSQDILLAHMTDHHRVFTNLALLTSACLLDQEGIKATLAFITSRTNYVEDMEEPSNPLELAGKQSRNSRDEDPDPSPAAMEELPDISYSEERENSLDVGEKSFNEETLVNEVSVEESRSEADPLESYQDILLGLESSQSEHHSGNQKRNISALEYLSEDNSDETDDDGGHLHLKPSGPLTLQDLQLYRTRTDHSYSKLKRNKIIKKKTKMEVLKPVQDSAFDVTGAGYLPELKEENINLNPSEMKGEEEWDIPDEDLQDYIKNYLSRKESRRERLLALCSEECGEKKAREANDCHLRRYHAGLRPFPCPECPMKFKKEHKLQTHKRLKHTTKSNNCDICGKYFASVGNVAQHKKTVHLLNQESQTCDISGCGKVFKSLSHLRKHKQGTHAEKHQCPLCGIKMRRSNYNVGLLFYHFRIKIISFLRIIWPPCTTVLSCRRTSATSVGKVSSSP